MSIFMPILGFCASAFRPNNIDLQHFGSEKWPQGGGDFGDWNLKFISLHFYNINNLYVQRPY